MSNNQMFVLFVCALVFYFCVRALAKGKPKHVSTHNAPVPMDAHRDRYILSYVIVVNGSVFSLPVDSFHEAQVWVNTLNLHAVSHVQITRNGVVLYDLDPQGILKPSIDVRV